MKIYAQSPNLSPADFTNGFDIVVDETKVSGITDHSDFPMLIDITNANLRNTANGGSMQNLNGYDLLFTSDCDEVLPHYIESYTEATGNLIAWVRVPTLYATSSTTIKMNYGNASITDNSSSSATWGPDYETVHDNHSDFLDGTSNNHDGTNTGSTNAIGQIADCQEFNGSNQYIQTTSDIMKTSNNFTLSAWFKADQTNAIRTILWQGNGTGNGFGNMQFEMHIGFGTYNGSFVNDVLHFFMGDIDVFQSNADVIQIETPFSDVTNWHHVAVVCQNLGTSPSAEMFLDGVSVGVDAGTVAKAVRTSWNTDFRMGRPGASTRYFDGKLDEVHVINAAHTSDWILTEYNNQNSPGTFYTVTSIIPPNNDDVITGNVFEDLDADGVKDIGEVGHSNATVNLLEDVNEDGLVDVGDVVIASTASDANGDYTLTVPRKNISKEILINENDAEQETTSGNTFVTSGDMDMGYLGVGSPYTCGYRYDNITIPNSAIITKAYLEFVAFSSLSGAVEITIDGQDIDNAPVFADGTGTFDISSRTRTSEKVNWSPAAWTAEQTYFTPDLSNVVQEIVDRAGWSSGNALAFIVEGGLNKREAYGWSSDPDKAAKLIVEYYVPPVSEYYLVNMDETSLPTNFAYSTASEYDFNFTSCSSESSASNDFGIQLTDICGNGLDDNNDGNIDEPYPAGIGENMLLWLKAAAGFSATTWLDQSPNGNNGTVIGNPTQVGNSLNFNPGINFDGDDRVEVSLPELVFESGSNSVAIFAVYKPSTAATTIGVFGNRGGDFNPDIAINDGSAEAGSGSVSEPTFFGIKPHLVSYIIDEENNISGLGSSTKGYSEGAEVFALNFNETVASTVDPIFQIGAGGSSTPSLYFQGDILEVIVYYENNGNFAISDSQRQQIESYLGTKYGITLSHNYTDSQ